MTLRDMRHKEEGEKRRNELDVAVISEELAKRSHPLTVNSIVLYNIPNGQVASQNVNLQDSVVIDEKLATSFRKIQRGFLSIPSFPRQ